MVQAQHSVASANESLISSLYAYNVSKVELGRAIGMRKPASRNTSKESDVMAHQTPTRPPGQNRGDPPAIRPPKASASAFGC